MRVDFTVNAKCNLLNLNGSIEASSAIQIDLGDGSTTHESGSNQRYVLNGEFAKIYNPANITYLIDGTGNGATKTFFDDGTYPIVKCSTATHFSPQWKAAPTSTTHGKVVFEKFQMTGSVVMQPVTSDKSPRNDFKKVFEIISNDSGAFDFNGDTFDAGFSTWGFTPPSGNMAFPVSGSTSYGDGTGSFVSNFYGVKILAPSSAGRAVTLSAGEQLFVNSLEIADGAIFKGESTPTNESSVLMCVNRPKIDGAWNFKQITEGIYATLPSKFKINFNGEDGMKIAERADHTYDPKAGFGVLWVKNDTPNKLYFTDDAGTDHDLLSGGGGGSGTVTSIATSAPITGGTITNTGTIGISAATTSAAGSMSGADKTKLDAIEASADVTDEANVKSALDGATLTAVTVATDDKILIQDTNDSNNLKTVTTQAVADLHSHPIEYARWYGKNTGSDLYTVSSGGRQYLDLADTSKFGESSTGTHSNITLVNASTDYVTLTAGGIYQIVISLESFPSSTVATHDRWVEVNTNSSANRALGTARMQNTGSSNGNWNAQKTVVHEIPSSGSDVDVYISFLTNGTGASIRAYDDNRISVAITRLGDASV